MADACTPTNIPDGINLVAYYVDGLCAALPVKGKQHVGISSVGTNAGTIGDCEPGNPPPAFWVDWVQHRRAAGVDPTIYCADDSLSDFFNGYRHRDVVAAFEAAKVAQPHYWLTLPGATSVPLGAVAVQNQLGLDGDRYDLSLVVDFWPGVDITVRSSSMGVLEDMSDSFGPTTDDFFSPGWFHGKPDGPYQARHTWVALVADQALPGASFPVTLRVWFVPFNWPKVPAESRDVTLSASAEVSLTPLSVQGEHSVRVEHVSGGPYTAKVYSEFVIS